MGDVIELRRGRLTDQERERIADMAERNPQAGPIAKALNRSRGTIGHYLSISGLRHPTLSRRAKPHTRAGRLVVAFSPDEDAFIKALRSQGYSLSKIAEQAGKRFKHTRLPSAILHRLQMLATIEED